MIATSIFRMLKMSFTNFWRNIWLSIATISVLVLTLVTLSILIALNVIGNSAIASIENKIDISVYLKPTINPEQSQTIEQHIRSLDGVSEVTFISKEQALQNFRERHKDSDLILESLTELDDNPLQPSFIVLASGTEYYQGIAKELSGDLYKDVVQEINYKDNKDVIERLTRITSITQRAGIGISIIFISISVLVAFNTVRLTIYTRKQEIEIMRLVGASNWFIRWPFLFEGIFYGIVATIINFGLLYPALIILGPKVNSLFINQQIDILNYVSQNLVLVLVSQFGVAMMIGIFSSFVAIRRYLKI